MRHFVSCHGRIRWFVDADMSRVEFLWFDGCPNHQAARILLDEVIGDVAPGTIVEMIDASEPAVAVAYRFPGSPTIRVDGIDIDPDFADPGEYSPRCRLYRSAEGLRGIPPRGWVEDAVTRAQRDPSRPGRPAPGVGATGGPTDA